MLLLQRQILHQVWGPSCSSFCTLAEEGWELRALVEALYYFLQRKTIIASTLVTHALRKTSVLDLVGQAEVPKIKAAAPGRCTGTGTWRKGCALPVSG